ncbi:MAG: YceI family protein [Acidimicrobiales bacterium]|jgi:polyisoprenoid-binding protein YceI|nr:YceI family protein [Acidimicrobiales bacterium]
MTATPPPSPRSSRRWWVIGGIAALVVVVVGGGLWWFLRDDAPDAVNLEDAVEAAQDATTTTTPTPAEETTTTASSTTSSTPETTPPGIEGTWVVDTSIGTFDFESADGTFVGFRVEEELTVGATTAVGRTGDVTGSITIEGTTLTITEVEADLTTLTTNDSRRDDRVQSALATDDFPTTTFVLTAPVELGDAALEGGPVAVDATGDLTIKGTARQVTFALEAQLVGDVVAVVGSADILLSDFGVEAPSAPIVLSVSDTATIEFQLLLTRG